MCKVKEGAEIVSLADLQNLVTSVILRQTATFSKQEIYDIILGKTKGSCFENSEEIYERCIDTISELHLIDCIRSTGNDRYKLAMSFPATSIG